MTVRDALNSALDEEMSADPKVFLMGEEVGEYQGFKVHTRQLTVIINSAAKSNYMSAGQISVPIVFRGPNGAAARVGAQHSHASKATWRMFGGKIQKSCIERGDFELIAAAGLKGEDLKFLEYIWVMEGLGFGVIFSLAVDDVSEGEASVHKGTYWIATWQESGSSVLEKLSST
ncbi:pyruvate dehydrogenase E1 component subunit beta-1, mitochondrial-like [Alnus glutinosa]|uniref:pyruvate dehydrogenase E1 component subunit beta-1, mitochondrial-like n=1 Tax=Alnus glutinosa TaxID=3517 RepID=UPI002D7768D5|nr:pyruvate dehydrogenase E1 component subunit beta-1, mitochondrial-like [Alnus glutinosa]